MFTDNENELEKFELHLACFNGDFDWVVDCLKRNFDVNLKDKDGYTPLHWNAWRGAVDGERSEITELLIKSGADINSRNRYDDTILVLACASPNADIVRQLLEAGAKVNENPEYTTALIEAVKIRCFECVKLLIQYGEDVNTELKNGVTALNTAIGYEWNEIAEFLKEKSTGNDG